MAMVRPKTILISGLPNKMPLTSNQIYFSHSPEMEETDGVRKRKRLTHLSQDERMLRRKLKNRVAAQTARDRKKQRMEELEEAMIQLEEENQKLQNENEHLKTKTENLLEENVAMKAQLGDGAGAVGSGVYTPGSESAALTQPQQQARASTLLHLTTHCLAFLITLSVTSSLDCSSRSATQLQKQRLTSYVLKSQLQKKLKRLQHSAIAQTLTPGLRRVGTIQTQFLTSAGFPRLRRPLKTAPAGALVGATTEELESFKELIQFDHVYYKQAQQLSPLSPRPPTAASKPPQAATAHKRDRVVVVRKKTPEQRTVTSYSIRANQKPDNKPMTYSREGFRSAHVKKQVKLLPKGLVINHGNSVHTSATISILKPQIAHGVNLTQQPLVKSEVIEIDDDDFKSTIDATLPVVEDIIKEEMPLKLELNEQDLEWLSEHFENELKDETFSDTSSGSLSDDSSLLLCDDGLLNSGGDGLCGENSFNGMDYSNRGDSIDTCTIIAEEEMTNSHKNKRKLSFTLDSTSKSQPPKAKYTKTQPSLDRQLSLTTGLSFGDEPRTNDTFEPFDFLNTITSESGYGSEHSDIGSPKSDSSFELEEAGNMWEESFTDLFPNLV